ncbi:2149_t:CDS:1, partial [Gigaspora rosea]
PLAGYIVARPLPHFGASVHFSPAMITNLCNEELSRPEPKLSTHTEPKSKWKIALPKPQGKKVYINYPGPLSISEDFIPLVNMDQ